MNILYIAKKYGAIEEAVIAEHLKTSTTNVLWMDEKISTSLDILKACEDFKPDVILFHKFLIKGVPERLISELREKKILTVSWTFDLHIGHPFREPKTDQYSWLKADLNILTDGGHDKEYAEHGIKIALLRQGINDHHAYIAMKKPEYECDVVLVGTIHRGNPEREVMVDFLKQTYGDRFKRWGDAGQIRGEELNYLYRSAKVVIGDSMASPYYWSNRIYEVTGRGGFMLSPYIHGLQSEFTPGVHYVYFERKNYDEMKKKIDYYIVHDDEREKIALAGFRHCKANYKYSDRCRELLKILRAELKTYHGR